MGAWRSSSAQGLNATGDRFSRASFVSPDDPQSSARVLVGLHDQGVSWRLLLPDGYEGGPCGACYLIKSTGEDLVHDLHAREGLPEKEGHHGHVEPHMHLAGQQIALLHQGREGGGQGD